MYIDTDECRGNSDERRPSFESFHREKTPELQFIHAGCRDRRLIPAAMQAAAPARLIFRALRPRTRTGREASEPQNKFRR